MSNNKKIKIIIMVILRQALIMKSYDPFQLMIDRMYFHLTTVFTILYIFFI